MAARKIKLTSVKYKHHPIGSLLTVGPDITKESADFLVKWLVAEEVVESKVTDNKGGKNA